MPKSKLNREDYKTAIPQLERRADTYYEMIQKQEQNLDDAVERINNELDTKIEAEDVIPIINQSLVVENHETGNITSTHVQDARLSISKAGYMPIGIVGLNANGQLSSFANVYHWKLVNRVSGSCEIRYYSRITGYSGSTSPAYTIAFHVLWLKEK